MAGRRYHDLVIFTHLPETNPDGSLAAYTVRVFESPAGEGEHEELVEIPDHGDLCKMRGRLGRRKLTPKEQITLGRRLADLILPNYACQLFRNSLSELGPGEGLRLRLRLLSQLSPLPWEYIYLQETESRPAASNFLALDPRISIVRHEAMAIAPQRIPPGETRRIFIAMATPRPYDRLDDLPLEQRLIREALGQVEGTRVNCLPDYKGVVEWDTIPGARPEELQAEIGKLEQVDIFHFSGHGLFEPESEMTGEVGKWEGRGYIILASNDNVAIPVPGDELAGMLRERGIRLVTLGACETATADHFDAWSSVAGALLVGRIPSVVAMQFSVYSKLAASFMAAVYEALVDGRTIDEAVFQGRAAIRARSYGEFTSARDWGTPVLYSRVPGGHIFPPVTDEHARQQAQQSIEVRSDLHQAWWEWMDQGGTASKSQLRYLAAAEGVQLEPMQILLLLRSAVFEDEPVEPWLARLREQGTELVAQLDEPGHGGVPSSAGALDEECKLLGLDEIPSVRPQDVGPVAWAAVSHPDLAARQTDALALTALPEVPGEGLARLDRALRSVAPRWKRFARQAELRGTLADGDAQIARWNAGNLPPWDRAGIWFWRFRRRARRQSEWIRCLALGAAVGAGVALGAQRGLLAIPAGPLAGARFGIHFFWGGLLGAAIGLAVGLAGPMLVVRREEQEIDAEPSRRTNLTALLLGTMFFGLMHILVTWVNGLNLSERALILVAGTVTGFGVNLALYGQPKAGWRLGIGSWLLRLAAAVLPAILGVWLVIAAGHDWAATAVTRTGEHLGDDYGRYEEVFELIDQNQALFSYLDAVLAGLLLAIGIAIGWRVACKRLLRSRNTNE